MIKKYFLSIGATLFFLVAFAFFSALATFIESYYDTQTAWALVYGTLYFGLIQVILGINLIYNIFRFNMAKKSSIPAFIFHISFIFILLGSILTRYFGFEGTIHIRENSSSNLVQTRDLFISLQTLHNGEILKNQISKYISSSGSSNFEIPLKIDDKTAILKYKDFTKNAVASWVESKDEKGEEIAIISFSLGEESVNKVFFKNDSLDTKKLSFIFGEKPVLEDFIKIHIKDKKFYINTNLDVNYTDIKQKTSGILPKNQDVEFKEFVLYKFEELKFSAKNLLLNGVLKPVQSQSKMQEGTNAISATLNYNGEEKSVILFENYRPQMVNVGGKNFEVSWSPDFIKLPFSLYLKDFKLDRYPGSNSPASYSSDVVVKDGNFSQDAKIYMNNVLDYKKFRFFQSSYDMDEKGTILSVNKDPGKIPTYFGYFFLGLGFFLNLINPKSRFLKLAKLLKNSQNCFILAIFLLCFGTDLKAFEIDKNHADNISRLVVQGFDGRMKPFDTVSKEVLSKIYGKDSFKDLNSNQVMLSMITHSELWRKIPIIKIHDKDLKKLIGINEYAKYACFDDFYEANGKKYKMLKVSEIANRKSPSARTQFDKDVIKVDERVNILYMVFMGDIFKIVPKQNDPNKTWFSPLNAMMYFADEEAKEITKILQSYFGSVVESRWQDANKNLQILKDYQEKYGHLVIPTKNRLEFEILFNKLKLFQKMMPVFLIAGIALLIVVFIRLMKANLKLNFIFKSVYFVNILAFVILSIGLILRWYISKHAPWSNTYESMVFIAWALSLSGIVFSKTSAISLALTSIMAGITLFVAHLSSIDPQITNLVPVLNSYWLTIHVSVITSSYGFFGLCSILGGFTLILFLFQNKKENPLIEKNILEATRINEMSMILGISLLTLGNFLGGVWANESWGRYWGWDSKETWALISILIYAAIVHFRFVPKLNNQYAFAVASMVAFLSILMTYFGVNFYLSGMHSYAQGEPIPVPWYVYAMVISMAILAILASFKIRFAKKL